MPVEPRFDPVIHEPMRLRICGILSAADCGVVTTHRRCASSPASGRCAVSRYRTLGVWLTAEISIFFKPSYGGYTNESVSGTAGLPTTVLT